jgi:hypothetical protein
MRLTNPKRQRGLLERIEFPDGLGRAVGVPPFLTFSADKTVGQAVPARPINHVSRIRNADVRGNRIRKATITTSAPTATHLQNAGPNTTVALNIMKAKIAWIAQ